MVANRFLTVGKRRELINISWKWNNYKNTIKKLITEITNNNHYLLIKAYEKKCISQLWLKNVSIMNDKNSYDNEKYKCEKETKTTLKEER